jgi:hypothetical protein
MEGADVVGGATVHGAAGPALGYLYQSYLPLVELARRAPSNPELLVRLELLDDVEFEDGHGARDLLQSKHHIDAAASLSDTSVDLWRSINAWITAIGSLRGEETPRLTLLTTASAPEGSAARFLSGSDEERDHRRAAEILRSAALSSVNQTTKPWRNRFSRLSRSEQDALVEAIVIADGQTQIDGLDEELASALFWAIPGADHRDGFIAHVKGWWLGIVVSLLTGQIPAFSAIDMLREIADIRDQFGPDNLPTDPGLPDPDAGEIAAYEERTFVGQLRLIAATEPQLALAIRDCHRAFTQRSQWLRRDLIGVGEIDRFERRLVEEWRFVFTNLTAELAGGADEHERQRCGREIFTQAAGTARARVRAKYEEAFMTRGSLHLLSEGCKVGWHPDFEARIQQLLEPVVEAQ